MAKKTKRRIPIEQYTNSRNPKIPTQAYIIDDARISEAVTFSFKNSCENHFLLSTWKDRELSDLIKTFKTMESLDWNQIYQHNGLRYKLIDQCPRTLPHGIPPDVSIFELRVNEKSRLFGYRSDNICNIIWFDNNHLALPCGKQRA